MCSDPLGLVDDCAKEEILRFREAELMHGRVAMMATLGFAIQEVFHPMFGFANGPAARQLDQVLTTSEGLTGGSFLLLVIFMTELSETSGIRTRALCLLKTPSKGTELTRARNPAMSVPAGSYALMATHMRARHDLRGVQCECCHSPRRQGLAGSGGAAVRSP
jgi:hypothetical protein